jgi:hypothetical protein
MAGWDGPAKLRTAASLLLGHIGGLWNDLQHFQAKWMPVRVKKMRRNKNLEPS